MCVCVCVSDCVSLVALLPGCVCVCGGVIVGLVALLPGCVWMGDCRCLVVYEPRKFSVLT